MKRVVTRREFLTTAGAAGVALSVAAAASAGSSPAQTPDLIVHHGKIVTVDPQFSVAQAMAVAGERIVAVGTNDEILKMAQAGTRQVDLRGKTVLPGLIDSHLHPISAAMFEFDHTVPDMETIADVLDYVRSRAAVVPEGQGVDIQQVFITRLRERRFPTRQELDQAAPKHPVCFRTGPDASLNSLALRQSGIDRNFKIADGQEGVVERDPQSGEPTGILRNAGRFIKVKSSSKSPTPEERVDRLKAMLAAYNEVGITSISDRAASGGGIALYQQLLDRGQLSCRVFLNGSVNPHASLDAIEKQIRSYASHPLHPYRTLFEHGVCVGGGSDHMQKIGRRRSINSYDPFLGIWTTLTRQPRWTDEPLHPEQSITRRQAIELYTINNAYLTFEEKEKGSLEPGKLADFIVLDKDILTCPVDDVKDLEVEQTYLGGKCVHQRTPG